MNKIITSLYAVCILFFFGCGNNNVPKSSATTIEDAFSDVEWKAPKSGMLLHVQSGGLRESNSMLLMKLTNTELSEWAKSFGGNIQDAEWRNSNKLHQFNDMPDWFKLPPNEKVLCLKVPNKISSKADGMKYPWMVWACWARKVSESEFIFGFHVMQHYD